jgi:RimJ/RimL family protein N-acetyltransferase
MELLEPRLDLLPAYVDALERGWSPDNIRGADAAREELAEIREDAAGFVARQIDREAKGPPITLLDGSKVARLPGYRLWIWDDGFCGTIGFRWQPGTAQLPAHVFGHIGYAIVPWKRRLGHATRAMALMRDRVHAEGMTYAAITTEPDNIASQKVITSNGGFLLGKFVRPPSQGGHDALIYRWYTGRPRPMEITTERLRLRQWRDGDRGPFAAMNADPRVMEHFPKLLTREESDAVVTRVQNLITLRGWGFWAAERRADGRFIGFIGVTPVRDELPIAPAVEIGWRLTPDAWGQGYATEGARASLQFAFETLGLSEVVAYTAPRNENSMAVMRRLGMTESEPFDLPSLEKGHRLQPHRVFRLAAEAFTAS